MKEEMIKNSLDGISLSEEASKRMYDNIQKKYAKNKKKTLSPRIIIPVAAYAALLAVTVIVTGTVLSRAKDVKTEDTFDSATTTVDPDGLAGEGGGR